MKNTVIIMLGCFCVLFAFSDAFAQPFDSCDPTNQTNYRECESLEDPLFVEIGNHFWVVRTDCSFQFVPPYCVEEIAAEGIDFRHMTHCDLITEHFHWSNGSNIPWLDCNDLIELAANSNGSNPRPNAAKVYKFTNPNTGQIAHFFVYNGEKQYFNPAAPDCRSTAQHIDVFTKHWSDLKVFTNRPGKRSCNEMNRLLD